MAFLRSTRSRCSRIKCSSLRSASRGFMLVLSSCALEIEARCRRPSGRCFDAQPLYHFLQPEAGKTELLCSFGLVPARFDEGGLYELGLQGVDAGPDPEADRLVAAVAGALDLG